jgi:cyclopropane fatty-acyl-phospholipid synthase-like methyltransferase
MPRHSRPLFAAAAGIGAFLSGALPLLGLQLGSRPAEEWAITLESGQRLEGLEIEAVVEAVGLEPGQVVADIGAGTGIFSVPMARAVGASGVVLAVEVDAGFLPIIAEKAESQGVANVEPVLGEFGDPNLPRDDVDVAFFHDVLHHIQERQAYLGALAAYMAPDSRIVVVDYDMNVPGVPHSNQPEMLIGPDQVREWMDTAGFEEERVVDMFDDKFFVVYRRVD